MISLTQMTPVAGWRHLRRELKLAVTRISTCGAQVIAQLSPASSAAASAARAVSWRPESSRLVPLPAAGGSLILKGQPQTVHRPAPIQAPANVVHAAACAWDVKRPGWRGGIATSGPSNDVTPERPGSFHPRGLRSRALSNTRAPVRS